MEIVAYIDRFIAILSSTIDDVLPILAILIGFQLFVIRKKIPNFKRVVTGFGFVLIGLVFFLQGLEQTLFPIGRLMAAQLTDPSFIFGHAMDVDFDFTWQDYYWVYIFAFAIGFSTTIAEPSLLAVAIKAQDVSGGAIGTWGLRLAVALGVAIGIALGTFRIVTGYPIHWFIVAGYVVVVIQTFYAPRMIIPLAFDSGGVTTSTVTVPLVAALGLGLAETVPGRSALIDGFGLIAFASLFPIMSVMAYAQIAEFRSLRAQREMAKRQRETEAKSNGESVPVQSAEASEIDGRTHSNTQSESFAQSASSIQSNSDNRGK